MTTAAIFALIAVVIFLINISLSVVNLVRRETVIPMEAIWGVWLVGVVFLILSWVV